MDGTSSVSTILANAWLDAIAGGYAMTEELSERERVSKETLEAIGRGGMSFDEARSRIKAALKLYEPKPKPVPVLPVWGDLSREQADKIIVAYLRSQDPMTVFGPVNFYSAIREITAKVPE